MKKVSGRLWLLTLVILVSIVVFLPSYQPVYQSLPSWIKGVLPNKGITLGLDLQGGIHMVLEVDEDRAVEIAVDRSVTALQDLLTEKKLVAESVKRAGHDHITIQLQNADAKSSAQKMIDNFPIFVEKESAGSANTVVWELREAE